MVLFIHNRYRTTGGEERVLEDLLWLVREQLGERAELFTRDSSQLGRTEAAIGLLRGGSATAELASAVKRSGARVVHAHNLHPSFGWRSLQAARRAGARVVLHLHQYRLVCAVGVCFTQGEECTRCHAQNTLPGVLRNCRESRPEALAYALALSMWQRRLIEQADVVLVPSEFALARLAELGAPIPAERTRVLPPLVRPVQSWPAPKGSPAVVGLQAAMGSQAAVGSQAASGSYALVVSRLAPEKGVDVAIDACLQTGRRLLIVGDGPEREALVRRATRGGGGKEELVRFLGRVDGDELAQLRSRASVALVPSRSAETFGMAAAEAMAAGLPVIASRVGALPELVEEEGLVPAGDAAALAQALERRWGDEHAGERGRRRVMERCSPELIASSLLEVYGGPATG